ncbi:expressed unknown protein [Ectocarpus siliculosus]|uniref:Uncharacterized protein n=1 Tax=Ectocarpus siliculosus TaxID=2880 RepID=D7FLA5_ECTSI|nr:expressed unknown protein [Ectocarpus siliculosus]|eukprot:CBJ29676.1 expressed unknown protein [Ectocarpus siliculosus]
MNGEDIGSRDVEIIVATLWLLSMGVVLIDTLVHTLQSLVLQVRGRDKGGGVAVLLAAAGASDIINTSNVVEGCRGCWYLDDIKEWHLERRELHQRAADRISGRWAMEVPGVEGYAEQLSTDHTAAIDSERAAGRLAGQLAQAEAGESLVAIDVDTQGDNLYRALLNRGREHYWVMTTDRLSLGGGPMLEPRVLALEHLHTHRRACKWDKNNDEMTVRNSVLQWYRARATASAASVRGVLGRARSAVLAAGATPSTVLLRAARATDQIDASWWGRCVDLRKAIRAGAATFQLPGISEASDMRQRVDAHLCWMRLGQGMPLTVRATADAFMTSTANIASHPGGGGAGHPGANLMASCWARSSRAGLDGLKHRNDWRDVTLEVYGTTENRCVEVRPDGEEVIGLVDALEFKGAGENVGGMHAELWYNLLVVDRVAVMDRVLRDQSMQVDTSTLYYLGMEYLGLLRVATRRAGRHFIRVVVPLAGFDVTAFLADGDGSDGSIAGLQVKAMQALGKEVWTRVVSALGEESVRRWYDRQSLLPSVSRTHIV